jgi:hypothetical protein
MPARHFVLELKTGRDSKHTPESAVQLFATIPELRNNLLYRMLGRDEHLSFEILIVNQTIRFLCYVPERLVEYLKAGLMASYPEATLAVLDQDPVATWFEPGGTGVLPVAATDEAVLPEDNTGLPLIEKLTDTLASVITANGRVTCLGNLTLRHQEYLPLKTFQDFSDVDPLVTLLSALSKAEANHQAIIQLCVADDGEGWKQAGHHAISGKSVLTLTGENGLTSSSHPQQALIERKLKTRALKVGIRLAIQGPSIRQCRNLLESLAATYNSLSQSEGNALELKTVYFWKKHFLRTLLRRDFFRSHPMHLTLEELATLFHLPNEELSVIPNISWQKNLLGEPPADLPIITKQSDPAIKKEINVFAQTIYKNSPVKYGLWRADRRRHMYVIGKTGTGKSTLLANMGINDLKNNEGMCVIDPHGDLVETLLNYIPAHRINDVVYFNPADLEKTVQINLFEGKNVEHRELIASGIISVFQKLYGYSWGPRLEYILRNALLTLLKSDEARLSDVLELLTNPKFRDKYVSKLDDPILKGFWVHEFDKMQERLRTEAIAPILNKVGQFVSSPLVRNVVNAQKSSFDIEDVMDQGKILLVNLSQGRLGEDNATLLGAMLITKIQIAAMARVHTPEENRRDFYLYVDEFQNFATESFNKILSEARKYRLNLILANQYIAQIPEEVQKAIFGNCGSIVSFVMGADDAAAFEKEFGGKYTATDLVTLGKHQIVNKITIDNVISLPFPAHTLPIAKSHNLNREKVIRSSRERYAKVRTKS